MGGGRWKSHNKKNVYLSLYVEEPLNSKVIKSFVPELRSRKCFSCFGIPMFYVYMLRTFYVRFPYPYHGYGTTRSMLTSVLLFEGLVLIVPHVCAKKLFPPFIRWSISIACNRVFFNGAQNFRFIRSLDLIAERPEMKKRCKQKHVKKKKECNGKES